MQSAAQKNNRAAANLANEFSLTRPAATLWKPASIDLLGQNSFKPSVDANTCGAEPVDIPMNGTIGRCICHDIGFGLKSEFQLVELLDDTLTNRPNAKRRDRSVKTVNTQLKGIFRRRIAQTEHLKNL